MTTEQMVKRAEKSQALRCMRLKDGTFLVESSDGKIMYPVSIGSVNGNVNGTVSCTCADYQRNSKTDPAFRCKHILAALECENEDTVETAERKKPRLDERFIKNLAGKDFVLYNGLISLAHERGITKLEVEIVQFPSADNGNEAICRAVAETRHGERFADIGDASARNCNKMIASHIIRMASTRAKARCLRDLCNIGMTCVEELGDLDDIVGADKSIKSVKPATKPTPPVVKPAEPEKPKASPVKEVKAPEPKKEVAEAPKPKAATTAKPEPAAQPVGFVQKLSEAQKRAMYNVSRRRAISTEELEGMVKNAYNVTVDELTQAQASQFIRQLQTAA